MKQRIYHREELDGTEEIVREFQKLRDEVLAEVNILNERVDEAVKAKTQDEEDKQLQALADELAVKPKKAKKKKAKKN